MMRAMVIQLARRCKRFRENRARVRGAASVMEFFCRREGTEEFFSDGKKDLIDTLTMYPENHNHEIRDAGNPIISCRYYPYHIILNGDIRVGFSRLNKTDKVFNAGIWRVNPKTSSIINYYYMCHIFGT